MKSYHSTFRAGLLAFAASCLTVCALDVGKISDEDLAKKTKEAGEQIMAIQITDAALSEGDQKLLTEIATGGMMQLELSKLALTKASHAEVKAFAQAEVDEQTGLGGKLKSIAAAKNAMLPSEPDEKTKKMLASFESKTPSEFDKAYLEVTGVKGHETLKTVMEKVKSEAKDENLQEISKIALPLIELHLTVAKDEAAKEKK